MSSTPAHDHTQRVSEGGGREEEGLWLALHGARVARGRRLTEEEGDGGEDGSLSEAHGARGGDATHDGGRIPLNFRATDDAPARLFVSHAPFRHF